MNSEWVQACNPIDNQRWAYLMLYVDTDWLTALRYEAGLLEAPHWEDIVAFSGPRSSDWPRIH